MQVHVCQSCLWWFGPDARSYLRNCGQQNMQPKLTRKPKSLFSLSLLNKRCQQLGHVAPAWLYMPTRTLNQCNGPRGHTSHTISGKVTHTQILTLTPTSAWRKARHGHTQQNTGNCQRVSPGLVRKRKGFGRRSRRLSHRIHQHPVQSSSPPLCEDVHKDRAGSTSKEHALERLFDTAALHNVSKSKS